MGLPLRMDNLHAPTVPSGPTSIPVTNGGTSRSSLTDLQRKKENIEAELKALSGVLDSVCGLSASQMSFPNNGPAWRQYEHESPDLRWFPASRHRRCTEYEPNHSHARLQY